MQTKHSVKNRDLRKPAQQPPHPVVIQEGPCGQCKKVSPEGDEPIKGTLLWEFGKRFAEAANQSMDLAAITFGGGMLITTAMKIKIRERLISH